MNPQDKREHKVKCHHGMKDYYRSYKNGSSNPVSNKVYSSVLKDYLGQIRDAISKEGYSYKIPQRLGRIELRKNKREVKVQEDGTIKNTLSINWKATKKLWEENYQAKLLKTKIRYTNEHTDGYVFRIAYLKSMANFKNKAIYRMSLNREMRRATEKPIIENKVDAFLLTS